jgi:GNAT superfamily N-acetyltransferase
MKTFHLEMYDSSQFVACVIPGELTFSLIKPSDSTLNKFFYESVGKNWEWTDRLSWSDKDWEDYVSRQELHTWVATYRGERAGYFELEQQGAGDVEIAYFGLLPEAVGKKLGGPLLSFAIERAWRLPATKRVWVHTCTKDHPHALGNYQKRGFKIFREVEE